MVAGWLDDWLVPVPASQLLAYPVPSMVTLTFDSRCKSMYECWFFMIRPGGIAAVLR
jgi:hypothetical protein